MKFCLYLLQIIPFVNIMKRKCPQKFTEEMWVSWQWVQWKPYFIISHLNEFASVLSLFFSEWDIIQHTGYEHNAHPSLYQHSSLGRFMATEMTTFMNISLQILSLQHIRIKAVGNAQLPPTIIITDSDLVLSSMCTLNTLAPELNTCTDLHETGI